MAQTAEELPTIKELMERERIRLTELRADFAAQLEALDAQLAGINAYFDAMSPSAKPEFKLTPPRQQTGARHPRGYVQQTVLKTITEHPQGITSAELIAMLKQQGIGQQSISNALATLTASGKITSEGRGGKYRPGTDEVPTAPAEPSS